MFFAGTVATSLPSDQTLNQLPASSYHGWVEISCQDGKTFCNLQEPLTLESFLGISSKTLFPALHNILSVVSGGDAARPPASVTLENNLSLFTPISFSALAAPVWPLSMFSEPSLPKSNLTSKAGGDAMKHKF